MKKKYKLLFLSIIGFNGILPAQQKSVTLEEAIQLGLQNSKLMQVDEAKIQQAQAKYLGAKNNKLPSFSVTASALALANAEVDIKILKKSEGGNNTPKANSAYFGNASFSLPFFAGGKIKYGIQSAQYLIDAAKFAAENDKQSVAYTIAQAYNNLYKASKAIDVLNENLAASQERDRNFLNLENNGVIARNDRLKANLQTSEIQLQLLDAQNNFNIANINLDLLLGLPETTIVVLDSDYVSENLQPEELSYYLTKALQNRKDLQVIQSQKQAAELGIKSAKAENLPTIALSAGYVAADIPKILSVYNAANIGLGIQYNLSNIWKKNSALLDAEAQIKMLNANDAVLNDTIKIEINRDFQNYLLAKRKIEVYENTVQQANENYRITKNKYDNGLETITNLLEANTAQIAANVNVLNAKADAALAYRKLLQTSGILIQ